MQDPTEFKKLQKEWYEKLKDSGFKDIETDEYNLKVWVKSLFVRAAKDNEDLYALKQEYYRLAGQMLYDYQFANDLERFIWDQHSQGVSLRNISKAVRKIKNIRVTVNKIRTVVSKLVIEMKKMYGLSNA